MNLNTTSSIKKYSIVQASGHQYLFEAGRWYDLNKIQGQDEDIVQLGRVLFHRNSDQFLLGKPCLEGNYVLGEIVQHYRGKKTCVLKYKAKKKYRKKIGFRPSLSRVLIKRSFENLGGY
jgi:large subunit ribosomal protein L21